MTREENQQETDMNNRIVLETSSSNPDYSGDCDYALVELTPELVNQVRRRVELAGQAGQQDNDLYEIYFWGGTAAFFDGDLVDACQAAVAGGDEAGQEWLNGLERVGHALVPPAADLAACQPQRTECDHYVAKTVMWRPTGLAGEYAGTVSLDAT